MPTPVAALITMIVRFSYLAERKAEKLRRLLDEIAAARKSEGHKMIPNRSPKLTIDDLLGNRRCCLSVRSGLTDALMAVETDHVGLTVVVGKLLKALEFCTSETVRQLVCESTALLLIEQRRRSETPTV